MTLYCLSDLEDCVQLYARIPEDIGGFIEAFQTRCTDPRKDWPDWLLHPDPARIRPIDTGLIYFSVGPVHARPEEDLFWQDLRVTADFTVRTNYESVAAIARFCADKEEFRIGPLYLVPRSSALPFSAIPADVLEGLCRQDLAPFYDRFEAFQHQRDHLKRVGIWCSPEQLREQP